MPTPDQLTPNWTPAELVTGIQAGDRAAESELVSRYRRGVQVILRRTLNSQDIEDLWQEVFVLVIEKIRADGVREPERLSGFICSLARNLALGALRKMPPAGATPGADQDTELEDPADGPLRHLLRQEDNRAVQRVLAELPALRDRQLLIRFYLKEEPKDRLCREYGISSLHFNRVLHRARARFRELWESERDLRQVR